MGSLSLSIRSWLLLGSGALLAGNALGVACTNGPSASTDSGCPSRLSCELCDASGYVPTAQRPPIVEKGACSPDEIAAFAAACFGDAATQQTCGAWQTSEADAGSCVGCVITTQSAPAWGALVCTSTTCSLDTAGCVDLELAQVALERQAGGSGSCGDLLSDSYGCQDHACSACSTVGSPSDFSTCADTARGAECKPYSDALTNAGQCSALLDADAGVNRCFLQTDTDVPAFVDVFCGTGP